MGSLQAGRQGPQAAQGGAIGRLGFDVHGALVFGDSFAVVLRGRHGRWGDGTRLARRGRAVSAATLSRGLTPRA